MQPILIINNKSSINTLGSHRQRSIINNNNCGSTTTTTVEEISSDEWFQSSKTATLKSTDTKLAKESADLLPNSGDLFPWDCYEPSEPKNMDSAYEQLCQLHCRATKAAAHQVEDLVRRAYEKRDSAEAYVRQTIQDAWNVCHFHHLPKWLQDNDYLHTGHRPPLQSFKACFWSVFRKHTETGNIWTHGIGFLIFLVLSLYKLTVASHPWSLMDKAIFGAFFLGAVLCLGFSTFYHTVSCHSPQVGRFFSKLDYCGIALLITGSIIPWLYYAFYCDYYPKVMYTVLTTTLCVIVIILSLWDKFSEPSYRPVRATVFVLFGLSGVFPGGHWLISHNWFSDVSLRASFICLIIMAVLYLSGALLYACRIPERFFPGKCDYWFHSHQIFHILVIAAAMVHYRGISELALHRLSNTQTCDAR